MPQIPNLEKRCVQQAKDALVGRKIVKVSYMTRAEAKECLWHNRPLIIELDDGTVFYAACDEEGNGAGALFVDTRAGSLTFGRLPLE